MSIEVIGEISPSSMAAKMLDDAPELHAVLTVLLWKDGSVTTGWSKCKTDQLALMNITANIEVAKAIEAEPDVPKIEPDPIA